MDDQMMYMPYQIALILGKNRSDILEWMKGGKLRSVMQHGRLFSSAQDVADFLRECPEEIGRVYCDDLIPFFNQARANIVEKLENLNEVNNLWQGYPSNKSQVS